MNTIALKTNLHCGSCLAKLKPILDAEKQITKWEVDLQSSDKTLTVTTQLNTDAVKQLVAKAGFTASETNAGATVTCEMPVHTANAPQGFWKDKGVWKRASFNTLNCLIGCSIGDFGMIIFLQAFYPETPMMLQMTLAIIAGLVTSVMLETGILRYREKLNWQAALKMAVSMSFMSMIAMELAMNATDFMITGGGRMAMTSAMYWLAFLPAALAGFLVPLPYNYYKLKKYNKACH